MWCTFITHSISHVFFWVFMSTGRTERYEQQMLFLKSKFELWGNVWMRPGALARGSEFLFICEPFAQRILLIFVFLDDIETNRSFEFWCHVTSIAPYTRYLCSPQCTHRRLYRPNLAFKNIRTYEMQMHMCHFVRRFSIPPDATKYLIWMLPQIGGCAY